MVKSAVGTALETAEATAEAPSSAAAAPAPTVALSQTAKFAPWIQQLEGQLLEVALEVTKTTTGASVESGAEDLDEDELVEMSEAERRKQIEMGSAAYEAQHLDLMRRLGARLSNLNGLIHNELLPRMPQDPEALFLAAAASFTSRQYDSALTLMQHSMLAAAALPGHVSDKTLAARHYFVALIAIKITTEAAAAQVEGCSKIDTDAKMTPERRADLCGIIERGLTEALRLDPRLQSAYIDAEMLAQIRHPDDPHARVACHARTIEAACATRKHLVSPMQRPMHFYPKLRSQPWWDPFEFPWELKLMQSFNEIRAEMLRMREPATAERRAERWDHVGATHDSGDRELVENGSWTELVPPAPLPPPSLLRAPCPERTHATRWCRSSPAGT